MGGLISSKQGKKDESKRNEPTEEDVKDIHEVSNKKESVDQKPPVESKQDEKINSGISFHNSVKTKSNNSKKNSSAFIKQKSFKLKKRAFTRGKKGFQLRLENEEKEIENEEEFSFLSCESFLILKLEEKKTKIIEKVQGLDIDLIKDDFNWLFDEMTQVTFSERSTIYKKDQNCPYFFIFVTGMFKNEHDEELLVANLPAIIGSSICAETVTCAAESTLWFMSRLRYQQLKVDLLRKRIAEGESLLNNIQEIPGLKELPKSQIEQLANSLNAVEFKQGEILLEKGSVGTCMFFIQKGSVIVTNANLENYIIKNVNANANSKEVLRLIDISYLESEDEGKNILVTRSSGEYIGEGALLESLDESKNLGTRNANVVAAEDMSCLMLKRADFELHMGSLKELFEHNFCVRVLKSLDLFKDVHDSILLNIASLLEERTYELNAYVVTQGEIGDEFFIVKDGTLECRLEIEEDKIQSVGSLLAGDYFGEGALLTQEPRRCHIVVVGDRVGQVWVLNKQNFEKCLSRAVKEQLLSVFARRKGNDKDSSQTNCNSDKFAFTDLENIKTLGSGSFGTVELVRNKITGETMALKRIKKATVIAKKQQRFIQNEKELLSSMNSPFIINLIQTFKTATSVYMVCEVCLGGELYTFMKNSVDKKLLESGIDVEDLENEEEVLGCFDIGIQVRFFAACIIQAIEYIHNEGIIHRDIKPENLMIAERGYLKLVDFGFAKKIFGQRTFSLCGTPEYTAPEVYKRIGHGKQVDYWALGVIIYEMSSGFSPFHIESQNSWDCYQEISKYERFYPRIQFPSTFPPPLESLLLSLMHPNPMKRFGTIKLSSLDLKNHEMFKANDTWEKLDWNKVESQEYEMPKIMCPETAEFSLDVKNFTECQDKHIRDHETVPQELIDNDLTNWDEDF